MKTALKYLSIAALAIATVTWFSVNVRSTEEEEDQDIGEDLAAREAFYHLQAQDENGQIPPNALVEALEQKAAMPFLPEAWAEFVQAPDVPGWVAIGPGNIGGRIRSLIIHPTSPATMWVGSVSGGVWKTTNGGGSWSTNTDLMMANLAVGCMAMDPANPGILYAGTGEGFFYTDSVQGDGIYKTTDGGNHWAPLDFTHKNPNFHYVNRLAISPTNSQLLLAATSSGIFRSTDGGGNWDQRLTTNSVLDVRFRPIDGTPQTDVPGVKCIAGTAGSGAYYSFNDGLNWTLASGLPALPHRVELAYSRSNPLIVYASVEVDGQLYKSINGGVSFAAMGGPPGGTTANLRISALWVDPTNPNTVLVGGYPALWRTTQGGTASWQRLDKNTIHSDQHVIVEHPNYDGGTGATDNTTVYVGNDGGVYQTTNVLASPAPTWTKLNNNLAITQFYGGAGNVASGTIIGGTQDNFTLRFRPQDGADWSVIWGGDGGFCAADQTDPNYFYGEGPNLQIFRSTDGGNFNTIQYIWNGPNGIPHPERCNNQPCALFIAPFVLDPNNPNTILAGGQSLWRSTNVKDAQPSWTEIKPPVGDEFNYVSAIAVAQGNSDIVWVGYVDSSVYRTANATAATPTWTRVGAGQLPGRYCTRITIGSAPQTAAAQVYDPDVGGRKVYATFGAYKDGNVWRTQNNGDTWTDISGTGSGRLPSAIVRSLVVSPSNPDTLYVGTEVGVFAGVDDGANTTWSPGAPGGADPANVSVYELFWMGNKLVAATHGRGMFTIGH